MNLKEHTLTSETSEWSRKLWLLDAGGGQRVERLGVFLDGEYYVDRMDAPASITQLRAHGAIPPIACVFVSQVDGAARHRDFACNRAYADFVVRDVVGWMRQQFPTLAAGDHLIAGTSLSGLEAAFATLHWPQLFSRCLSHSGSFWWNDEWLTRELDHLSPARSRFWVSVGTRETQSGIAHAPSGMRQEISQIEGCAHFAAALAARQHDVHYRTFEGGHEMAPWKDELPDALRWLLRP